MEIRGRRRCKECATEWSYYETGSVECPNCGSVHSVGLDDERAMHTASTRDLDLTDVRETTDAEPLHRVADAATSECREYVSRLGFVAGGELLDLTDGDLAAYELRHVADVFSRSFDPDEAEELYFLELLRGADADERPEASSVPASMRDARGLAYANAVRDYRREVRAWYDGDDPAVRRSLGQLDDHVKRIRMLDGDVEVRTAEALVGAVRDLVAYARDDDETALARVEDRLSRLVD